MRYVCAFTNSASHIVVFTVRSEEKGKAVLDRHPDTPQSKLSYIIVKDISQPNAFEWAVRSWPHFEAVIHTASPYHYNIQDAKKDMLDPAVIGTTGLLKAIKQSAPSVKRVVLTSSITTMMTTLIDPDSPHKTVSEQDWSPITWDEALKSEGAIAYFASKKFAEKAAWEFMEKEQPNFTLSTINPGQAMGPIFPWFTPIDKVNTSNLIIRDMFLGKYKKGLPQTGLYPWVDVRDVALAHVKAAESEEAAGKRFSCVVGHMINVDAAQIIIDNFPEYRFRLPELKRGFSEYLYRLDNTNKDILGLKYKQLNKCVYDTVKSIRTAEALRVARQQNNRPAF